jgi:beta-phosphoglucomutase
MPQTGILPAGAIFDMDGVLVDSNPFHLKKWEALLDEHGIPFDREDLPRVVLGLRNDTAFRHFFGSDLSAASQERLEEELEERFRQVFRPHAKPLPGLETLIVKCHQAGIVMAVASSAYVKNVEFIIAALGFGRYFRHLVTGNEVHHPKPHPEIYLKAAEKLGIAPAACVAFEDSFVGIESAKRAGLMCVAIASTFPLDELRERTDADLVVESFEKLDLEILRGLFETGEVSRGENPRDRRPERG